MPPPPGPRSASPWRQPLEAAAVAATAVWAVVVAVWPEAPFALTFDDAWYYFGIARNVAEGFGSTFDRVNPTNGYHPLWLAVCVVPYVLGLDGLDAARALLLVQVVVGWGVSTVLLARLVARLVTDGLGPWASRLAVGGDDDDPRAVRTGQPRAVRTGQPPAVPGPLSRAGGAVLTVVFFLVVVNPFVVKTFVNGLESGIGVTVQTAALVTAARHPRLLTAPAGVRRGLGALLAVAFLVRLDAAGLAVCAGAWVLAEALVPPSPTGPGHARQATVALAELLAPVTVCLAGYLLLQQVAFGTPVPVSGLVKRAELDLPRVLAMAAVAVLAAAVGRRGFRRSHGRPPARLPRFPRTGRFAAATSWYAAWCLLLVGYYAILQTQQWLWYFAPVVLWLATAFLLAVADLLAAAGAPAPSGATRRVVAVGGLVFVAPLAIGLAVQARAFTDPELRSIQLANREAGEWVQANVTDDAVLASWDAGVLGYFSRRRVVNLDGVVNSPAFRQALDEGRAGAFLRCERVGWVVNHGADVDGRDPDIDALVERVWGRPAGRSAADAATVAHVVPFVYSGTTDNGGFSAGGSRPLAVHVYRVDPALTAPRPDDRCP